MLGGDRGGREGHKDTVELSKTGALSCVPTEAALLCTRDSSEQESTGPVLEMAELNNISAKFQLKISPGST